MKITVFIDGQSIECHRDSPITVRGDQHVFFELTALTPQTEPPVLLLSDDKLHLNQKYEPQKGSFFKTDRLQHFREAFGLCLVVVECDGERIEIQFEVLTAIENARQVEEMIAYLTHKQNDIIKLCFSETALENPQKKITSEPEKLLDCVENFLTTLEGCRLELQNHLHKRLISLRQPAWKSSHISDVDPLDIIFNLDALEPALGDGDVVINGRNFSIREIELSTLEPSVDVQENAILLGGIYSMRRTVNFLNEKLTSSSNSAISPALVLPDYDSLTAVLLRLSASNIKQRCDNVLSQLEEFVRYFEKKLGLIYKGELPPIITPFVRSSRVYRGLFEQLHDWYKLGVPTLNNQHHLIKLRTISKIYEFVSFFKLIDFLHETDWIIQQTKWESDLEFVPSSVSFQRKNLHLTLEYETKIYPFSEHETQHFDLVDTDHVNAEWKYNYWQPDFVLKAKNLDNDKTLYLILDAKYSTETTIQSIHLASLFEKYFINMAVFDAVNQCLKQDAILGIIALFPDKNTAAPVYLKTGRSFGLDQKVVRFPLVAGLPITTDSNTENHTFFTQLFDLLEKQLQLSC